MPKETARSPNAGTMSALGRTHAAPSSHERNGAASGNTWANESNRVAVTVEKPISF